MNRPLMTLVLLAASAAYAPNAMAAMNYREATKNSAGFCMAKAESINFKTPSDKMQWQLECAKVVNEVSSNCPEVQIAPNACMPLLEQRIRNIKF